MVWKKKEVKLWGMTIDNKLKLEGQISHVQKLIKD